MEHIENKFSVKRVKKSSDSEYLTALKIYNETTAVDIRTNTNEITYWIDQSSMQRVSFEPMVFVLYLDDAPIGFAMMCYLKKTKIVLIDYLTVYDKYRINAVLFPYLSLLQSYLNKNGYIVSYIVNEVSNKNNGQSINKESKMFKKLFCLEGFGKLGAIYYFPQLGANNPESIFEAHLYIKSNDNISLLHKDTYLSIVESIYRDYNLEWYLPFFSDEAEKNQYVSTSNIYIEKICKSITEDLISVSYIECPILSSVNVDQLSGILPAPSKKRRKPIFISIILLMVIAPVLLIWLYTFILGIMGIPLDSISTIIGTVISASITSVSTITIAKKKSLFF
jgi:hypothetical protein